MANQQTFTHLLWESIYPLWEKIIAHPFLKGLADGTLSDDIFQFYITQDYHYIRDYGKGLTVIAAKADNYEQTQMFMKHAGVCFKMEGELHKTLLEAEGSSTTEALSIPYAPNCIMYSSYLMRTAYERPYYEAVAAFLPCYWIYWEVGKKLKAEGGSPNDIFQKWILTYSGEEFSESVKEVLSVVDRVAETVSEDQRAAMLKHFVLTTKMEYMFWDMSYNQQKWPI